MIISYVLTIIGAALELWGAWGLFNTKMTGLEKNNIQIPEMVWDDSNDGLRLLVKSLNDNIDKTNRENKLKDKKAKRYFALIILGFLFQLSSAIFSISQYTPVDNHATQSTSSSCQKHS
jgi:hypothetical protein